MRELETLKEEVQHKQALMAHQLQSRQEDEGIKVRWGGTSRQEDEGIKVRGGGARHAKRMRESRCGGGALQFPPRM